MTNLFQSNAFQLNFLNFLELFPILILSVGFAFAVLGAGLKFSTTYFNLLAVVSFSAAIVFWFMTLRQPDQALMFIQASPVSRLVGIAVSFFALLTAIPFKLAEKYKSRPEWLALYFLASIGLSLIPMSRDWVSFFVFLECFSIPAYILVGYDVNREKSLEAMLKYLLMGAFSSAFLLMGIALIYFSSGTLVFSELMTVLSGASIAKLGALFILTAVLFKMTVLPFHFWAPDVYLGAPTPVAAFFAASTKLAIFASASLAFQASGFTSFEVLRSFAVFAGAASIIVCSFLAFKQNSFRRMLAFSGSVNAGMVIPFIAIGTISTPSGLFFLITYGVTLIVLLCSLGSILHKQGRDTHEDMQIDQMSQKNFKKSHIESLMISLALISMAGIPPFPGFVAKYWALSELWFYGSKGLVIFALISTLLGVAYYVRLAGRLFFSDR